MDEKTKRGLLITNIVKARLDHYKGVVSKTAKTRETDLELYSDEVVIGLSQWLAIEACDGCLKKCCDILTGVTRVGAIEAITKNIFEWKHTWTNTGTEASNAPV